MILAALLGSALLAGCGDDATTATPDATSTPATVDAIRIADFLFEPERATVKAGEPVSVANADSAPHTLTAEGEQPAFDSGTIKGGERGAVTFSRPGTYRYYCVFHPTMKGTVSVTR